MSEIGWTLLSYGFYAAGSACFMIGTGIAVWRIIA
jgi:hypothetical protein